MKKVNFALLIVFMLMAFLGCTRKTSKPDVRSDVTKQEAVKFVFAQALKMKQPEKNLTREQVIEAINNGRKIKTLSIVSAVLKHEETRIGNMRGTVKIPEQYQEFWFVFIDDDQNANWEHPCRYVAINRKKMAKTNKVEYHMFAESTPPNLLVKKGSDWVHGDYDGQIIFLDE